MEKHDWHHHQFVENVYTRQKTEKRKKKSQDPGGLFWGHMFYGMIFGQKMRAGLTIVQTLLHENCK